MYGRYGEPLGIPPYPRPRPARPPAYAAPAPRPAYGYGHARPAARPPYPGKENDHEWRNSINDDFMAGHDVETMRMKDKVTIMIFENVDGGMAIQ